MNQIHTIFGLLCMILFIIPAYVQNVESIEERFKVSPFSEVIMTYPEIIVRDEKFNVSISLNSSYTLYNVQLSIHSYVDTFIIEDAHNFPLEKLPAKSKYNKTVTVTRSNDAIVGVQQLFVNYTSDTEIGALLGKPITILIEPNITIGMQVQEHIYTNAEFPFTVSIQSEDIVLNNATIKIIPPKEIEFRGNAVYNISRIDVAKHLEFKSMLVTPSKTELDHEHHIPFQVTVEYVDHDGMLASKSEVVMVLLRQKNIFEFNSDGGFWLGPIYIAPPISYGAIFIIFVTSLWAYKKIKKKKSKKKNRISPIFELD